MRHLLLLLAVACATPLPDTPTYSVHIEPMLDTYCVRCHTSAGRREGGVQLDTYESARSTRIRSACTTLEQDVINEFGDLLLSANAFPGEEPCSRWKPAIMPPDALDHLSITDQRIFALWIEAGALP